MRLHLIPTVALAALLPCAAIAQTGSAGTKPAMQPSTPSTQTNAGDQQGAAAKLASINKIKQDLQNAGFKDVQVVAEAFVVRAQTKDGDPVVMTMGPHGFTAFEAANASGASQAMNGSTQMGKQAVPVQRLTKMNLYDGQGNTLGDVEHVVANSQGGDSIVIGHGGFLGLGEKQVAVPVDNVVMHDGRLITHNLTNDQIKARPEWKRGQQADLDGAQTVQIQQAS